MRTRIGMVGAALVGAMAVAVVAVGGPVGADAVGALQPHFVDAWGSTGSGDGNLESPRGVATNDFGEVYVADSGNDRILQYDADGRFLRSFGSVLVNGLPLDNPWDVAVDRNQFVYVADTGNHRVVRYGRDGTGALAWGSLGSGNTRFRNPRGIFADSAGDVWVADTGNHRIKRFDFLGNFELKFGGNGAGNGQFNGPRDVTGGLANRVFVADTGNDRIQVFDYAGTFIGTFGSTGSGSQQFEAPAGVFTQFDDVVTRSVFVADTGNDRISVWDYVAASDTATFERRWGGTGTANRQMEAPRNVVVDSDNRRFVADTGNDRIQLFDPPVTEGIVGEVLSSAGPGVANAFVTISDSTTFDLVATARTGATGDYQVPVPPGTYSVAFFDPTGAHAFEYFDDQPDFTTFDPVTVTAGAVTTADATLTATPVVPVPNPGTIAGDLTEAAGPAAGAWAMAIDSTGTPVLTDIADATGHYEIAGLAPGSYMVLFIDARGANVSEFFDDTPDPTFADPVVVTAGATTIADADLDP